MSVGACNACSRAGRSQRSSRAAQSASTWRSARWPAAGSWVFGPCSRREGWRRRLLLLPFDCKPAKPDPTLKARLVPEYGRILAWAAEGCAAWRNAGFALDPPARVTVASEDYLASQDAMGDFIAERCELDAYGWTQRNELWAAWREYAEAIDAYLGAQSDLYDRLERELNVVARKREGVRGFARLRLRPPGIRP